MTITESPQPTINPEATVTTEQLNDIVSAWGGDYLPVEEPLSPSEADNVAPAKAEGGQEETTEPHTTEDTSAAVDVTTEAKEPKEEAKTEEAAKPEELDADTKRRLAIIERRESQFRQREKETKAAIEVQVKRLEELYGEFEKREAENTAAKRAARESAKREPLKMLQEYGLTFEELAIANLKSKNLPVPQELERLAYQAAAADPLKPQVLKEELGDMIDQRLNKILERMDSRENQSKQAYVHQQQALVMKDMERAVGHVSKNADAYPFLSTYLHDPDYLAQQMLNARDELFHATGRDSDIGTVAKYIENRYSEQFHPAIERVLRKKPIGQPQQASGNQPSPADRKSGDRTLSNEAGSSKVSSAPVDMDEAYEMAWRQAPAILRDS